MIVFTHRCLTKTGEELAIPLSHRPVKWDTDLRTVPTFATAHTFGAFFFFWMVRKRWVSKWRCLLEQRYFCAVYNYVGEADLGKDYWNQKRK